MMILALQTGCTGQSYCSATRILYSRREMKIMKISYALSLVLFLTLSCSLMVGQTDAGKAPSPAQVPTISADRGDCTATFDVSDGQGKPIYQANIHTLVRWGLAHKVDLTISTNYEGKAEFTHLPNYSKKPIEFEVKSGDRLRTVFFDPEKQCQAQYTVELR